MNDLRTQLLANEIFACLKGTTEGHCVRVDFLERVEAINICQYMTHNSKEPDLVIHVLTSRGEDALHSPPYITTDEAVEIRNRKQVRLCLFVPSDLVDAAYSSLANSFAPIDGRTLYEAVLKHITKLLPQDVQKVLRFVSHGTLKASYEQCLDYAVTALIQGDTGNNWGLELWRVGLIADARSNFAVHLTSNRNCTLALSHPIRLDATAHERIQSLKVDKDTANVLGRFFRGRPMNEVSIWSRDLAKEETMTFDRWKFPNTDHSDIRSVKVTPFINARGIVERFCHLVQPDEVNGSLQAICGPKRTMVVKWSCEPVAPQNLSGWSVRIVPSDREYEFAEDSDYIEPKIPRVPGHRRSVTIKLDIEEDEIPNCPVCVKVAPLDATGNEISNEETEEVIADRSIEFFLSKDIQINPPTDIRESRSTVPTLSYGRLEIALGIQEDQTLDEGMQPQWLSKDLAYFSLTFPNHKILNIGLSETLLELERQVRDNPRSGGCFTLFVDEVYPISVDAISPYPLQISNQGSWAAFWKMRETFFNRLKKQMLRDTIETAEWTSELANIALRYAQSYRDLLDELIRNQCELDEMREALSVDSLLVQVAGKGNTQEEAIVILPTHPLRVAWFAGYTQLLRNWEERLLGLPKSKRKHSIDMQALRLLTPTNVPAFAYHAASKQAFLFFQNIRLYHGVALPADVADPRRRYGDIALILGSVYEQIGIGDIQPDHLKEHLKRFYMSHSYAGTLVTTLVNPDRGEFFAEAVRKFLVDEVPSDEQEEPHSAPSFHITAFMPDEHKRSLEALKQTLQRIDQRRDQVTDYFLPGLSTTVRPISQLEKKAPEAHLAVVTDLTQPTIVVRSQAQGELEVRAEMSSFSLYGLVTRFISQFTTDDQGLLWYHRIIPEGMKKPEVHPVSTRYSETLVKLHQSLLDAESYLVSKRSNAHPMLEVRIEKERSTLLEHLHSNTNWVITMDRFFALDYYDSPHEPELRTLAQKYVLDYSPESLEGFGHRMMVTTAWHEEIEALLTQSMAELGFNNVDQSVSQLLHYLKTVSGRLALQALESPTSASAAVGLGVVTAWLQKKGRLKEAILVPVDIYPRIFSLDGSGKPQQGERRCDLVLVSLRRNIVDATFIEVKWRRGQALLQELATGMALQMEGSAQAMRNRFFNEGRVDSILQRSYLANVLRFYFERSRRYKLFAADAERTFMEQLARLEKTDLEFRPSYEGYIVNLEGTQRKPLMIDTQTEKAKITVLTARDFQDADAAEFSSLLSCSAYNDEASLMPLKDESRVDSDEDDDLSSGAASPDNRVEDKSSGYPVENTSNRHTDEQAHSPMDELKIPLGEAFSEPVEWMPSTKGSPHLFILGIPGQGKSWTITRILNELGKQQVPTLVLDFHGQFADPRGPFMQMIRPSVFDAAKGLPFSPFECTRDNGFGGWMANSFALAEIFAYITGLGPMQRDIIFTALQDTYKSHGFSDEEAIDLDYPTPEEVLKRIEKKEQERHINNVAARCRPLLEMNLFRPIKNAPDMLTTIRQGLIIDLHNLYAEELQMAAGAFALRKLYKDMFHWGNADRLRLAIVLDEAHRLAKDVTLPKLMKEGRKFGIAVIVASQGINDFHQDILGNAGTKIIFRVNYPDSKKVAGFIRERPGQDLTTRIEQLKVGSAYVQTPEMAFGSVVHMYPLE
ncbi:MAG TPA: ATP-binding protein [Ktedonobacteraceae bacterium]|jgi:hypothetical protein